MCNLSFFQVQTQKALPGATTDLPNGDQPEVRTEVIELPSSMAQAVQTMVSNSQAQTALGNVIVQSGLTTNQVRKLYLGALSYTST